MTPVINSLLTKTTRYDNNASSGQNPGREKISETATNSGLLFLNVSICAVLLLVLHYIDWFVIVTMIEFTLEKVLTILDNETYQRINLELGIACNLVISSGVGDTVLIITLSIVIIANTFSHVMSIGIGKYYTLTCL